MAPTPCNLQQSNIFVMTDSRQNHIVGGPRFCGCQDTRGSKCLHTLLKLAEPDAQAAHEAGKLFRCKQSGLIVIPPEHWDTVVGSLSNSWNAKPGAAPNSRTQLNKMCA